MKILKERPTYLWILHFLPHASAGKVVGDKDSQLKTVCIASSAV